MSAVEGLSPRLGLKPLTQSADSAAPVSTSGGGFGAPPSPNHTRKPPVKRYGAGSMSTEVALEAVLEIQQILNRPSNQVTSSMPQLPPSTKTPLSAGSASMPAISSPNPGMSMVGSFNNSNLLSLTVQRPPSQAPRPPSVIARPVAQSPAIVNVNLRRGNMSSPVPVKLGVPIRITTNQLNEKDETTSELDEDMGSESPYFSDVDEMTTSDEDEDEEDNNFPVTVFAASPALYKKNQQRIASKMPKLGSSLSNIHSYIDRAAPARPVAIPENAPFQEEDEEGETDEEFTPPARIPNPVPRNSPFWDRSNVNGAELGLFSLSAHAPFGEDEDRALRRLRVLGMPLPPPPLAAVVSDIALQPVDANMLSILPPSQPASLASPRSAIALNQQGVSPTLSQPVLDELSSSPVVAITPRGPSAQTPRHSLTTKDAVPSALKVAE